MKNIEIAKGYIEDAETILEEAQESFAKGHYHRVIRKCQEGVELSLKGLMKLKGIEYPKSHRVGRVLVETLKNQALDPAVLQRVADISDQLALDREPSFYGSDEGLAKDLFDQEDAEEVLNQAKLAISFVNKILRKAV